MAATAYVIRRSPRPDGGVTNPAGTARAWRRGMRREATPSRAAVDAAAERARSLAEVEALAWLLDDSIPIPGLGGRRIGLDALIGFLPGIGDLAGGALGLLVVWRGAQMGLPRIVVARMLLNTMLDLAIGAIPIAGDAFDLWFKASTRNIRLMRRHLERPATSTRGEWVSVVAMVAAVIGVMLLVGWLVVSTISSVLSLFG